MCLKAGISQKSHRGHQLDEFECRCCRITETYRTRVTVPVHIAQARQIALINQTFMFISTFRVDICPEQADQNRCGGFGSDSGLTDKSPIDSDGFVSPISRTAGEDIAPEII